MIKNINRSSAEIRRPDVLRAASVNQPGPACTLSAGMIVVATCRSSTRASRVHWENVYGY